MASQAVVKLGTATAGDSEPPQLATTLSVV